MAKPGGTETEIKLRAASAEALATKLEAAGFRVRVERHFESNLVFDREGELKREGKLLRVRTARGDTVVTYKGPSVPGRHRSRLEIEYRVSDFDRCVELFEHLGYRRAFRYDKWRAEWAETANEGVAALDETPIGVFLELEGPPEWIDRTAVSLGYGDHDYITASYARLYVEDCQRRGVEVADMTFEDGTGIGVVLEPPKGGA
ncbi:MAG: class IV adenylate cyclase [Bryobacteraceae bacterium]|nr:class IV adenylate cyclase [Bryobacteraceae bacterium]